MYFFQSKNGPQRGACEFSPPVDLFLAATWTWPIILWMHLPTFTLEFLRASPSHADSSKVEPVCQALLPPAFIIIKSNGNTVLPICLVVWWAWWLCGPWSLNARALLSVEVRWPSHLAASQAVEAGQGATVGNLLSSPFRRSRHGRIWLPVLFLADWSSFVSSSHAKLQ